MSTQQRAPMAPRPGPNRRTPLQVGPALSESASKRLHQRPTSAIATSCVGKSPHDVSDAVGIIQAYRGTVGGMVAQPAVRGCQLLWALRNLEYRPAKANGLRPFFRTAEPLGTALLSPANRNGAVAATSMACWRN